MGHSQIQKKVLRLFRDFLKYSAKLPTLEAQDGFKLLVRQEFRNNQMIPRINMNKVDFFHQIEYLLRVGKNKLQMLNESNVTNINFFGSAKEK